MKTTNCANCSHFDGSRCTKEWNNLDPIFYFPDRDNRDPETPACEDWESNED